MLINGSKLSNYPVLSLHIGGELARVTELIVDPNTLKLIAFRVAGPAIDDDPEVGDILPIQSVREFSRLGMVIDSSDELVSEDEVVRIQKVLKLHFALPGLRVITKKKARLGKVIDFTLSTSTWEVYQLIVERPAFKAFLDPELIISRASIIEVDDYHVVVKDEHEKTTEKVLITNPRELQDFVNPFRKPEFATNHDTREEAH